MPRSERLVLPGLPHHITQRGSRREPVFFEPSDYDRYLDRLRLNSLRYGLQIWSYSLLPNHVHLVAIPREHRSLALAMGKTHEQYSWSTNRRHGWTGHLWQERFYSSPMDLAHAIRAPRYVLLNPVRAGLARQAEEWPFSSARTHLQSAPDPLLDHCGFDDVQIDWEQLLSSDSDATFDELLRASTRSGLPLVSDDFLTFLESSLGRSLRPRPPGRPARSKTSEDMPHLGPCSE